MSKSSVRIHGAVSELVANAIFKGSLTNPSDDINYIATVNLGEILIGMDVTPAHRGTWHNVLKHRRIGCSVSGIARDNYHLTINPHAVILDGANYILYRQVFEKSADSGRLLTYLPNKKA